MLEMGVRQVGKGTFFTPCPAGRKYFSTGPSVAKNPMQAHPKAERIDYSPLVLPRLFNSVVAWRQQIGADTWPLGLRLIAFAKTQRYSSLWRSTYWQTLTTPRHGRSARRIFSRTFPVTEVTNSPLGRVKSFLSFAMKLRFILR